MGCCNPSPDRKSVNKTRTKNKTKNKRETKIKNRETLGVSYTARQEFEYPKVISIISNESFLDKPLQPKKQPSDIKFDTVLRKIQTNNNCDFKKKRNDLKFFNLPPPVITDSKTEILNAEHNWFDMTWESLKSKHDCDFKMQRDDLAEDIRNPPKVKKAKRRSSKTRFAPKKPSSHTGLISKRLISITYTWT